MDISNFTGDTIRLGDFPFCIDVSTIPNNHSDYGLLCTLYNHTYINSPKPRIMLITSRSNRHVLFLIILKYPEQWNDLMDEVKNGDIIFDSSKIVEGEK